jgi:DNA-binding NarL/FixJ family response regulator
MADAAAVRVLIADDHALFRAGLRKLLESEPGFAVAGESADGFETLAMVRTLRPDVLLLDVSMPSLDGIAALREMNEQGVRVRTVLLTASVSTGDIATALRLGARGVLLKSAATEMLFRCLRAVIAGEYWIRRDAIGDLVEAMAALEGTRGPGAQRPYDLTERELDVVRLVADGCSNRDIAAQLGIREDTVKHHLSRAFDKTGTSSRVELALLAVHKGLTAR